MSRDSLDHFSDASLRARNRALRAAGLYRETPPMAAERSVGQPPPSWTSTTPSSRPTALGSSIRHLLIANGTLVPATDRQAPAPYWHASPRTLRLTGTEDCSPTSEGRARKLGLRPTFTIDQEAE
jgi:hypothetical protein